MLYKCNLFDLSLWVIDLVHSSIYKKWELPLSHSSRSDKKYWGLEAIIAIYFCDKLLFWHVPFRNQLSSFFHLQEMKKLSLYIYICIGFARSHPWRCLLVTHNSRCDFHFLVITLLKDTFIKISWCLLTNAHRITC